MIGECDGDDLIDLAFIAGSFVANRHGLWDPLGTNVARPHLVKLKIRPFFRASRPKSRLLSAIHVLFPAEAA
jgi:hypothetical protein